MVPASHPQSSHGTRCGNQPCHKCRGGPSLWLLQGNSDDITVSIRSSQRLTSQFYDRFKALPARGLDAYLLGKLRALLDVNLLAIAACPTSLVFIFIPVEMASITRTVDNLTSCLLATTLPETAQQSLPAGRDSSNEKDL